MLAKLCSKSFKLGFSSMWTKDLQMYNLSFEEVEEPEIKLPTFIGPWRKQRISRKIFTSVSLTTLKPLTVWITTNCGKFLKRQEYQTTFPVSWETCIWAKKERLELDLEQRNGSNFGKEYNKAVICHTTYLIYVQSTSYEMPGWMNHKLESKFLAEITITSDMQMTPP